MFVYLIFQITWMRAETRANFFGPILFLQIKVLFISYTIVYMKFRIRI